MKGRCISKGRAVYSQEVAKKKNLLSRGVPSTREICASQYSLGVTKNATIRAAAENTSLPSERGRLCDLSHPRSHSARRHSLKCDQSSHFTLLAASTVSWLAALSPDSSLPSLTSDGEGQRHDEKRAFSSFFSFFFFSTRCVQATAKRYIDENKTNNRSGFKTRDLSYEKDDLELR